MSNEPESTEEWIVSLHGDAVNELANSLTNGPIQQDGETQLLLEYLVDYSKGLKIEIFANEHPPPHFRVRHGNDTANYRISDCVQLNGDLRKFRRNVQKWHAKNKQLLIKTWNETRPTDCPVGEYRDET